MAVNAPMSNRISVEIHMHRQVLLIDGEPLPFAHRLVDTTTEGWPSVTVEIPANVVTLTHHLTRAEEDER